MTNDRDRDAYVQEMRPLAKKYNEYLVFTTVDANEYPEMERSVGLTAGAAKALSVQKPNNGDVFPYQGKAEISMAVVEQFLLDIIGGRVTPWRAQPTPQQDRDQGTATRGNRHDEL